MEERILEFWRHNDIFGRSVRQRADSGTGDYLFYDGPPFATGLPHFGHFVPGTIKDIFPRYHAMRGKRVERRFGWDCHGLPVEYEMEKELGISGRAQIEEYGVARFNEACRSIVLRYTAEWRQMVERMGRWVDLDNDYRTMDVDYMESIWWVFKQLWDKQLIYESYYILPYSPGLATPLSNFEVNLGGYRQVSDPAITVGFKLRANQHSQRLGLAGRYAVPGLDDDTLDATLQSRPGRWPADRVCTGSGGQSPLSAGGRACRPLLACGRRLSGTQTHRRPRVGRPRL